MRRALLWMTAAAATALAGWVGLAEAGTLGRAHPAAVPCHARVTRIARGQGSPDDLVWDGHRLLVSDINRGTIGVVERGRVHTLVSHLRAPEGIVPANGRSLIVAEQKTNSVVEVRPPKGRRRTLAKLPLPKGGEGVDGINADGRSAVFVPDSARGRLYALELRPHRLKLVASGMNRPVAAIRWRGATVVADEYANAVWRLGPQRTELAPIPLPDDLVVISHHLIATSLTGEVWELAPHLRLLSDAFKPTVTDPQGLAPDGPSAVILADQGRNAIYRLSRLASCL